MLCGRSVGQWTTRMVDSWVLSYDSLLEIHSSARKYGIADEDIEHATARDDNRRSGRRHPAVLGPSRSADLLEIVTIVRDSGSELAIHAMKTRTSYRRLRPGG